MSDAWRRVAVQSALVRGTVMRRYPGHYIHPNGILPAGMRRVMRRVFHGR